jgi:hypothetical protein
LPAACTPMKRCLSPNDTIAGVSRTDSAFSSTSMPLGVGLGHGAVRRGFEGWGREQGRAGRRASRAAARSARRGRARAPLPGLQGSRGAAAACRALLSRGPTPGLGRAVRNRWRPTRDWRSPLARERDARRRGADVHAAHRHPGSRRDSAAPAGAREWGRARGVGLGSAGGGARSMQCAACSAQRSPAGADSAAPRAAIGGPRRPDGRPGRFWVPPRPYAAGMAAGGAPGRALAGLWKGLQAATGQGPRQPRSIVFGGRDRFAKRAWGRAGARLRVPEATAGRPARQRPQGAGCPCHKPQR